MNIETNPDSDIYSKEKRSAIMAKIRAGDTTPEILLRSELHKSGFRYRLRPQNLPGRPDIVLPKYQTVIFVHGCFWHRHHKCKRATVPKKNRVFWLSKFAANVDRDKRISNSLRKKGWQVLVAWECEVKKDVSLLGTRLRRKIVKQRRPIGNATLL